jgi:hypothetical protein
MANKRAKLPGADILFNKDEKQQDVKTSKRQNVLTSKGVERITTYLSNDTIKDLEKARVVLLTEHNIKVQRSQLIEAAIRKALESPDDLAVFLE